MTEDLSELHLGNRKKNRILHIDDDKDFFFICEDYLMKISNDNLIIDPLSNPHNVLSRINDNSYDLILCDYLMPEKTGLDILKELKDNNITFKDGSDEMYCCCCPSCGKVFCGYCV